MLKAEHIETYGWEAAIREAYRDTGVRKTGACAYEAYISNRCKYVSCGTYKTESEARIAVANKKIEIFTESVVTHGDDPATVVESVDKGYFVSPKGNVYNRHGELMIGAIDHCGYRHVILNKRNRNVHRVVAETFIQNPNNLPCVNHKDGNKQNNNVSNLEWCTYSENTLHSIRMGLQKRNGKGLIKKYA